MLNDNEGIYIAKAFIVKGCLLALKMPQVVDPSGEV
jgi:hypothetical protein